MQQQQTSDAPEVAEEPRKKLKRPRAAQACEACRSRKVKCDESYPCSLCQRQGLNCEFKDGAPAFWARKYNSSYVRDLEKKVEDLSAALGSTNGPPADFASVTSGANAQSRPPTRNGNTSWSSSRQESSRLGGKSMVKPAIHPGHSSHGMVGANSPANPEGFMQHPDEGSDEDAYGEVTDVNEHTRSLEFHGNTSSMAVLGQLQRRRKPNPEDVSFQGSPPGQGRSLVSNLHNPAFSPHNHGTQEAKTRKDEYYYRHALIFMDGYFENLHFIHPFLNRTDFVARAEMLWLGQLDDRNLSFKALYFSVLSLGALIREWDGPEGDLIDGLGRFDWSRRLFNDANECLYAHRFATDLDTVQCLILMAKICQNELNPHLAYMYLGIAIRTCLSAGFNRDTPADSNQEYASIAQTWWGLFSLEIEMSFALGRSDTLGMDEYHNRRLVGMDNERAIIPAMIKLAKLVRKVSINVYQLRSHIRDKLDIALAIDKEIDEWVLSLPARIQPNSAAGGGFASLRDPKWARRQRMVLHIRSHNVKMLLFRPFVSASFRGSSETRELSKLAAKKCMESARETIRIVYETYQAHTFFQTWWYNTTYIMFAASVLLLYATRVVKDNSDHTLFASINMAIDILEAMNESPVARQSAEIIKVTLREAQQAKMGMSESPAARESAPPPAISGMLTPGQEITLLDDGMGMGATLPTQMYYDLDMQTLMNEGFDGRNWMNSDAMFGGFG